MTNLLRTLGNEQAFLKAGIYGFAGSGKTYTASLFAIGLAKMLKINRVAFFETETGSNYVVPTLFKPAKIELVGMKSKAFIDCVNVIRECEQNKIEILIIDSITHVWNELVNAYLKKHNRTRLRVWDWGPLKEEWRKLTNAYLSSKVHIFLCGRAGYEYEQTEDEDGNKEIVKTGIKMKTETEMGYEPSLLILMKRGKTFINNKQKIIRTACIEKDRFGIVDGMEFENPVFENILPHVNMLNLGGDHIGADLTRNSDGALSDPDWSAEDYKKRIKIALGEIKATFDKYFPSSKSDDKQAKIDVSEIVFGLKSPEAVMQMPLDDLEGGLKKLENACKKKIDENKNKT